MTLAFGLSSKEVKVKKKEKKCDILFWRSWGTWVSDVGVQESLPGSQCQQKSQIPDSFIWVVGLFVHWGENPAQRLFGIRNWGHSGSLVLHLPKPFLRCQQIQEEEEGWVAKICVCYQPSSSKHYSSPHWGTASEMFLKHSRKIFWSLGVLAWHTEKGDRAPAC